MLLRALDLKPGMVLADTGAGTGFLSRRMARAVAPSGAVLAADVQPEMLVQLRDAAQQDGLFNVTPLLGCETDVKLQPYSVDLSIMVDADHELAYPDAVLARLVKALKPGGQVVFVEYRAEDANVPIKPLHKMSEAQALGLIWIRTVETLPWQHVVVFRKAE